MSLEIKKGSNVCLYVKSTFQPRSGTIVHVSATSIILELDRFNYDKKGQAITGNHNFTFEDIVKIESRY